MAPLGAPQPSTVPTTSPLSSKDPKEQKQDSLFGNPVFPPMLDMSSTQALLHMVRTANAAQNAAELETYLKGNCSRLSCRRTACRQYRCLEERCNVILIVNRIVGLAFGVRVADPSLDAIVRSFSISGIKVSPYREKITSNCIELNYFSLRSKSVNIKYF